MASDQMPIVPDSAGSAALVVPVPKRKKTKRNVYPKLTSLTHCHSKVAPPKYVAIKQEPGIGNVTIKQALGIKDVIIKQKPLAQHEPIAQQEPVAQQEPSIKKTVVKAKSTVISKRCSAPSSRRGKGGATGVLNALAKLQKHQQVTQS